MLRSLTAEIPDALAIGAHGCNDRFLCSRMEHELRDRIGDLPVLAVNDAELLLPAVQAPNGVGLVAGTGSVVVGYDQDGEMVIAGGWGGYIGDEGSSTGMFRDAARAVAHAYDRGEPEDPLAALLCDSLEIDHLRELPAALDSFISPPAWAALTPDLFTKALDQGSVLIVEVIEQQALALANLIDYLRGRGAAVDTVVAGGGVIVNAAWFQDALTRAFAEVVPESTLVVLDRPPVQGALALANDLAVLTAGLTPDHIVGPVLRARFQRLATAGSQSRHGASPAGAAKSSPKLEGERTS